MNIHRLFELQSTLDFMNLKENGFRFTKSKKKIYFIQFYFSKLLTKPTKSNPCVQSSVF